MTLMLLRGWMNSFGSKSRHLAAERREPAGRRQLRQRPHAAPPRGDRLPHLLAADADRRDDAQAGDDDFPLRHDAMDLMRIQEA